MRATEDMRADIEWAAGSISRVIRDLHDVLVESEQLKQHNCALMEENRRLRIIAQRALDCWGRTRPRTLGTFPERWKKFKEALMEYERDPLAAYRSELPTGPEKESA